MKIDAWLGAWAASRATHGVQRPPWRWVWKMRYLGAKRWLRGLFAWKDGGA